MKLAREVRRPGQETDHRGDNTNIVTVDARESRGEVIQY